jgi:hypothetical protein
MIRFMMESSTMSAGSETDERAAERRGGMEAAEGDGGSGEVR